MNAKGEEVTRRTADDEPFSALAFKIMNDPFVGNLTFFRVYSGTLEAGSYVYNATKEQAGAHRPPAADARQQARGDQGGPGRRHRRAWSGLRTTTTGDTLCDEDKPVILEKMEFPEPVIHVAIEPKTKADQDKMGMALQRLQMEDPSFRVRTDEETGQTIIAGMGELHLEILVDRMIREFKVEANVGKPQVAYRETITKHGRGRGQVHPADRRPGPVRPLLAAAAPRRSRARASSSRTPSWAASSPRSSSPPIEKGIEEAMQGGVLAGYPMVDVKVEVFDGSYHDVDSSEMAFKIAGSMGFKEGAAKAQPVLLEPIMKVEVVTPEEYMGDVIGDLNSRRGKIHAMNPRAGAPGHRGAWCRWPRCSATPPTCAPRRRAAPPTPCSSRTTRRSRASIAETIVSKAKGAPPPTVAHGRTRYAREGEVHGQGEVRAQPSRTSTSARSVTSTTARPR